jgi:hypothetical protein
MELLGIIEERQCGISSCVVHNSGVFRILNVSTGGLESFFLVILIVQGSKAEIGT